MSNNIYIPNRLDQARLDQIWQEIKKEDVKETDAFKIINRVNLDAAGSMFAAQQLNYVLASMYNIVEKDLSYKSLSPVTVEGGSGLESVTFREGQSTGEAAIIKNGNFPRVEASENDYAQIVGNYGLEYAYNIVDMEKAKRANKNLDTMKADAANRGMESRLNKTWFYGDGKLKGFFNYLALFTNVSSDIAADGTGGSKEINKKDFEKTKRDLKIIKAATSATLEGNGGIDTWTLAANTADYEHIIGLDSATGQMLTDYLQKIGITKIVHAPELNGKAAAADFVPPLGANKKGIAIIPQNRNVLEFVIPELKRPLPLHFDGYQYVQKFLLDCAGLNIQLPSKIGIFSY